jgi:NAD(P)-dependent dehydrogenase (short-subunit alcohol dehydrogenase family)
MTSEGRPVALVTGAAQGLGYGIASAFAAAGYDLAVIDLQAEAAVAAADSLRDRGVDAIGFGADVGVRADVDAFTTRTVAAFGRIDVLVNNAQTTRLAPVLEVGEDDLTAVWRSGFVGTLWCMQAAFPHLVRTAGSVVNLGSGAGLSATPGYALYGATKEAIRTLTRVTAVEWGPRGVRVNAISPSARTPALERWAQDRPDEYAARATQIPLQRFGDPEQDIGRVAVFLASPAASYMTGNTLVVDGGTHYLR